MSNPLYLTYTIISALAHVFQSSCMVYTLRLKNMSLLDLKAQFKQIESLIFLLKKCQAERSETTVLASLKGEVENLIIVGGCVFYSPFRVNI